MAAMGTPMDEVDGVRVLLRTTGDSNESRPPSASVMRLAAA